MILISSETYRKRDINAFVEQDDGTEVEVEESYPELEEL
jgi:hypothetical protein